MSRSFSYRHQKHIPQDNSSSLNHSQYTHTLHFPLTHTQRDRSSADDSMAACLWRVIRGRHSPAGLIIRVHSHHFPDTKSYVTAYLGSHIALGWWSESACFCLTEQETVEGGGRDLSVWKQAISHQRTSICHCYYMKDMQEKHCESSLTEMFLCVDCVKN